MEKDFDNNNENCIEFLSGEHYAVATFTNRKHINRIKIFIRIEKMNSNI